ncbi:tautomerase family protein [Marinospirillum insulare]|uniref:Tautomerase n=1 Tax=Marinospirillum insulare TaxID=217169 RepID=A0ABQ5ZYX8_9GAMM|nr:tautomerase family protein [Marinospirillum insulare]GLR64562.1 tautomerase [Marinospirillum insulare]
MPSALIETRQNYSPEIEIGIMDAVHSALCEAFKITPTDKNIRLLVHEPHRFVYPTGHEQPETYTHISIDCFAGRTIQAKRLLYKAIVKNLSCYGIPAKNIKILLREITTENWGVRGGQAACDVDLGFNLNV